MESESAIRVNVADQLAASAKISPERPAIVEAWGQQRVITFAELDEQADVLARGLMALGVQSQTRMALLVKPSIEFVTLVFALLRSGATMVLVDSGLGRNNIVRCLSSTEPEGFVAIPLGHALRVVKRKQFPKAKLNVNVGPGWLPIGKTLAALGELGKSSSAALPQTTADDHAAIVFTSGSTGPPKGVLYRHETFATQLSEIQQLYGLKPGGTDLACFPLFGLFNVALGITTVLPEMDFSRPAQADVNKLLAAANRYQVNQSFASPAVWDKLSRHCKKTGDKISTLTQVFSCGAPVSAEIIERTLLFVHPEAQLHTPYGATESLPVSTIEGKEILNETQAKTEQGCGVCVGKKVDSIDWRIIKITDDAITTIDQAQELPQGEIGELIVRGPQVSREYLNSESHNATAKIADGNTVWHRMGDVGYFDELNRFWYCGRKSQRVVTRQGTLYTECVEQVVNSSANVYRSALVGVGSKGTQVPCVVIEPTSEVCLDEEFDARKSGNTHVDDLAEDIKQNLTESLSPIEIGEVWGAAGPLPTDIRHNAKINREKLAQWAANNLKQ